MNFKEELTKYIDLVNTQLEQYVRREECPEAILNKSMEYSLISSAKRIRPILMISSFGLFDDNYKEVFPFAIAMEMIHNFSLIHDDLPGIDNDDIRHGKPTNHKKFNEATAILAGDGLLNYAYMIISKELMNTKDKEMLYRKIRAFDEISNSVDRMIAGEYVDTEFEGKEISNTYLEYMHNNKTGAIIRASCRVGVILAGGSDEQLEYITSYAENIGLAFQIKDDMLSEIGDEKVLGKPVGNDREKNKVTFVTKYGLQKSKEILNDTIDNGINSLDNLLIVEDKREFLREFAIYIRDRNK